jgi:hypothetical protein
MGVVKTIASEAALSKCRRGSASSLASGEVPLARTRFAGNMCDSVDEHICSEIIRFIFEFVLVCTGGSNVRTRLEFLAMENTG